MHINSQTEALLNQSRYADISRRAMLKSQTRGNAQVPARLLCLARALSVAADDLDPIGVYLVRIFELEIDVFDDKGPHIVAEAVRIKMTLEKTVQQTGVLSWSRNCRP